VKIYAPGGKFAYYRPACVVAGKQRMQTFPGNAVCNLSKEHLDTFIGSFSDLSAKSRNHYRAAIRQFLQWAVEVFIRSRRAILGSFLFSVLFAVMPLSAFASGSVTLAWNASTDSNIVGYNVYYGGASGVYTNEICAGNATNATISGLVEGTICYFAATTYSASGMESPFSSEVSFQVLMNAPIMNLSKTYTAVVCTNLFRFMTNTLPSGGKIVSPLPPIYTNFVFNGFWIYYPPSGVWTLQSSSNLLTWFDYATGTNAVFIPNTGGNWYFRFKAT
jgi:hypothetical protein